MNQQSRGVRCLYLSYDGLTDPLGRSQILPYLAGLAKRGHDITILSCEKPKRFLVDGPRVEQICAAAGIDWQPLRYRRHPPVLSSLYGAICLTWRARRLHARRAFQVVHCRSYMSALAGLHLKRKAGVPWIFDMRGFWIDERVEAGDWPDTHPVFRRVRTFFERREVEFLEDADGIVSLTDAAAANLIRRDVRPPVARRLCVIPCCVDFGLFTEASAAARETGRALLGVEEDVPVLAYLGSLGGNYMLDEMLAFFNLYCRENRKARFAFITLTDPDVIFAAAARAGVDRESIRVFAASREQVPACLAAADLGVAFKRPSYSAIACSPTKIGEMLAVGLPVVANDGVGDVKAMLRSTGGGWLVESFDEPGYAAVIAATKVRRSAADIRAAARQWFDLDDGVDRYDGLYRAIADVPALRAGIADAPPTLPCAGIL